MPDPIPNRESPRRRSLAQTAAGRAAAGQDCAPVLAPLRRLTAAELLACRARPRRPQDLAAAAQALCRAAGQAVRRRPGWLALDIQPAPLPAAVHGRLWQAALLSALRGVLCQPEGRGALRCVPGGAAALVVFHGGAPHPRTAALWRKLAQECGGAAVFGSGAVFTAAARLPLCGGAPAPAPEAAELLCDRYALLYQFLGEWAAPPDF